MRKLEALQMPWARNKCYPAWSLSFLAVADVHFCVCGVSSKLHRTHSSWVRVCTDTSQCVDIMLEPNRLPFALKKPVIFGLHFAFCDSFNPTLHFTIVFICHSKKWTKVHQMYFNKYIIYYMEFVKSLFMMRPFISV